MKAYTDVNQSKKLAEILPLESADMFYNEEQDEIHLKDIIDTKYPMLLREGQKHHLEEYGIPCWSLAALLNVLPESYQLTGNKEGKVQLMLIHQLEKDYYDNPIDACVSMIEKLHELKKL